MTPEEIKAERERLASTLKTLQESGAANTAAVAAVQSALSEINQKIAAMNLLVNRAAEGEFGESAFYTFVRAEDVKNFPSHYAKTEGGAVRLVGHDADASGGGRVFGLLDDPQPMDAAQRRLQIAVERRGLVRRILAKGRDVRPDSKDIWTPRSDWDVERAIKGLPAPVRKIFANSSGIGADLMPTRVSPEFEREVLAQSNIMSMFEVRDHPGGTLKLPYLSGVLQAFAHSVPTADDPSNDTKSSLGDGTDTVTAASTAVAAQVDREANEDAVIAIIPQLLRDMADALAFADDNTLVNGNVAGTQDALATWNVRGRLAVMTNNTAHQLRRWEGLRKIAIAASKNTTLNSAQTVAGIMALIATMGIEQLIDTDGSSKVVVLMNPEFFFKKGLYMAGFESYDKVGTLAAILSGKMGGAQMFGLPNQVGYLYGRFPVCLCYTMTADLNASGVWDNTTTDRTGILVVDRSLGEQWLRKGMTAEQDVEIRNNTITVVGRKRNTFRKKRLGTGQTLAAYGYNLTLT